MKYFSIFITFIATSINLIYGQVIILDQIDEFTKDRRIMTAINQGGWPKKSDYLDTKNDLLIRVLGIKHIEDTTLTFAFHINTSTIKFGCLSEFDGKAILLFTNGETMPFKQVSTTDCGKGSLDEYSASYIFTDDTKSSNAKLKMIANIESVRSNKISKIRIQGTEGHYDFELKPERQEFIKKSIELILAKLNKS